MRDAYGLIRLMFPRSKPVQALEDRRAYIPPHIQGAMTDHVQQNLPPHLKKYRGANTFVPEHAQAEMTQHLESSLPPHMKQYAGAYVQQHVVEPSLARRGAVPTPAEPGADPSVAPQAPMPQPNIPVVGTGQPIQPGQPGATVQPSAPGPNPAGGQPQASYVADPNQAPDQSYAFITNPAQPPQKSSLLENLPGGNSMAMRAALIGGALLVLIIVFSIFRSILTSNPSLDYFVTIVQEQQELIHLATNAGQQQGLDVSNQNLAATLQASLTTSQAETIKYLTTNHKKVGEKQLNLKVSAKTDAQLTDAAAAATYNTTFREIIQSKLNAYGNTLSQAYKQGAGKKGKALLTDSYRQQQLFQTQLKEPTN